MPKTTLFFTGATEVTCPVFDDNGLPTTETKTIVRCAFEMHGLGMTSRGSSLLNEGVTLENANAMYKTETDYSDILTMVRQDNGYNKVVLK